MKPVIVALLALISSVLSYDPDIFLTTPQFIRRHGYPVETHTIQTDDGYLLSVHRIPGNSRPVLLQHGLLSSSFDWVVAGNLSLAFTLANKGYDVWLGNARGNIYSKAHVKYPVESDEFWDFSFHEMGIYDLPAVIKHIVNNTGHSQIDYVGHSMGTTMFFVFASTKPQESRLVRRMVALAPVAFVKHVRSPIKDLAPFINELQWLAKEFGLREFLPGNGFIKWASEKFCKNREKFICENVIFFFCGYDREGFNEKILPIVLSHTPAGASTKSIVHYAQEIKNEGDFRQYDYGFIGNLERYHSTVPPKYKLVNIKVPIYIMYGDNDWLADPTDVLKLQDSLIKKLGTYEVPEKNFDHVDFLYGKNVYELINKHVINVLEEESDDINFKI